MLFHYLTVTLMADAQDSGNYSPSNASLNDDVHECVHVQELCSYLSSSSGSTEYSCQCFDPASDDNDGISTSIDLGMLFHSPWESVAIIADCVVYQPSKSRATSMDI